MLQGKVVAITGGAGLLGRSFVSAIADAGGVAVIADINEQAISGVVAELSVQHPGRVHGVQMDITSKESIAKAIAETEKRHGRIDAVVNSAYPRNANYGRKLEDVTYADFCENVNVHLGGYFLVAQQFALFFRERGNGNIINLASIYGVVAPRFDIYAGTPMTMPVEYAAIKSAIVHLTRYFAQYFKGTDIRVNCLSPGGILDKQPAAFLERYNAHANNKGMLDPQDIAGVLCFLLSDASASITGQNFVVDDGWTL